MPSLRGCRNASAFLARTLALRTGKLVSGTLTGRGPFFLCVDRCTIRTPFTASGEFCSECVTGKLSRGRTRCTKLIRNVSGDLKSLVSCLRMGNVTRGAIVVFVSSGKKCAVKHAGGGCPLDRKGNSLGRNKVHRPVVIY